MADLPVLILTFLLSLDPGELARHAQHVPHEPVTIEGEEDTGIDKPIRIPYAKNTRSFGTAPILVTLQESLERAEAREDAGGKAFFPKAQRRPESPYPPEVVELLKLQAKFLPVDKAIHLGPGSSDGSLETKHAFGALNSKQTTSTPPDAELAVGETYVIAVVNEHFQIFDTSGTSVHPVTKFEDLMWDNPDCRDFLFDPNVVYDEQAQRFLMGIAANHTDYCLAVSVTDDPLGGWAIYSFATDIGNKEFDFPHAGVGRQAFYVGANMFQGNYPWYESRIFAVDKTALYSLQTPAVNSFKLTQNYPRLSWAPQPLHLHGAQDGTWPTSGPDYVIAAYRQPWAELFSIDDPFGGGTPKYLAALNLSDYTGIGLGYPVDAVQPGSDDELIAGDEAIKGFEYRNGYGWIVQSLSCNAGLGTVNCLRWAKIDLESHTIADAGVFASSANHYALFPDLAVNRCDDMLVGFTSVGGPFYPSVFFAGRRSDQAPGYLGHWDYLSGGAAVYDTVYEPPFRWGDYTGATIAPNGVDFWYIGQRSWDQYGPSSNWETVIGRFQFADDDDDGVPNSCDRCPNVDDSIDADGDGVPDPCDVCPGEDDALDADGDAVPDGCDDCWGDDSTEDSDGDGICNDRDECEGHDDSVDSDSDGVADGCDACEGHNDDLDADGDGVPDACDNCIGVDDSLDEDGDGVADGCDICPGFDDTIDSDDDGIPDGCDACEGNNLSGNDDGDGLCNDLDTCFGAAVTDEDSDGFCDDADACPGFDDTLDADGDGVADGCDACPGEDDGVDVDGDGVPDACDVCQGDNASGDDDEDGWCNDIDPCVGLENIDEDSDGVCNSIDICPLGDDAIDYDGDGVPLACDPCQGPDNVDSDGDYTCDSIDICFGDENTFDDLDGDNVCEDEDCDDEDPNAQFGDRCGICGGDGTSCFSLIPITSEFVVTSTTAYEQVRPSITAGNGEFLVTWTSADADGVGVRGRLFEADGTAKGNDFAVNSTTAGSQDQSAVAPLVDGTFVVAWQSSDAYGMDLVGRKVDGTPTGSEQPLSSASTDAQSMPRLAPAGSGFQVVWQSTGLDGDGSQGVGERRFDSLGTPISGDAALTGTGVQGEPDVTSTPGGSIVSWIDETSGLRVQLLDSSGAAAAPDVQVDVSGAPAEPAVSANASGDAVIAWTDENGDGAGDSAVFARRLTSAAVPNGDPLRVSPSASLAQQAPAVAVLDSGYFLVAYQDDESGDVRAQVYASDGTIAGPNVHGSVVDPVPFTVNETDWAVAQAPNVAADAAGTFFLVWEDNAIDGNGTGIAGRLFGTDIDGDELPGAVDNCPAVANADQADADSDDVGDPCDACPGFDDAEDADGDDTADGCDTCTDLDDDGYGNAGYPANTCALDNCPNDANASQEDADADAVGNVCDTCTDVDVDGYGNPGFPANTCAVDNCPDEANAGQEDADTDAVGDVCDTCTDVDNDGYGNPGYAANTCAVDNCPDDTNADQADTDTDAVGDACDTCTDVDGDGYGNPGFPANTCAVDNCPDDANADQADADTDAVGDACDTCTDVDDDGFGSPGFPANTCAGDNCPNDANADQADSDADAIGDVCDTCTDVDDDGYGNPGYPANTCTVDNCPDEANADQADADADAIGDVCDTCTDLDGDGFGSPGFPANTCAVDNCPDDPNAGQEDADSDGLGDVCDACFGDNATGDGDGDGVCDDQDLCLGDDGGGDADDDGLCAGSPYECDDLDPGNECANVFADGFESGDTSAWSSEVN